MRGVGVDMGGGRSRARRGHLGLPSPDEVVGRGLVSASVFSDLLQGFSLCRDFDLWPLGRDHSYPWSWRKLSWAIVQALGTGLLQLHQLGLHRLHQLAPVKLVKSVKSVKLVKLVGLINEQHF